MTKTHNTNNSLRAKEAGQQQQQQRKSHSSSRSKTKEIARTNEAQTESSQQKAEESSVKAVGSINNTGTLSREGEVEDEAPTQINESLFSMRKFQAERDLPIVYCKEYNISVMGLELLHPFDSKKYAKLANYLNSDFMDTPWARRRRSDEPEAKEQEEREENRMQPRRLRFLAPNRPVNLVELEFHHTKDYVALIHGSKSAIARTMEIWALNLVPMFIIESHLLKPIKLQIAGTIFAFHLAMQHGWALNLGGGFHQAFSRGGETFCLFSDIILAIKYVWRKHPMQKFMIVDLDAHQGTGIEKDLLEMDEKHRRMVFLVDIYNPSVQPPNRSATSAIDLKVKLAKFTGDKTYLSSLQQALTRAFELFKPTLVIYVAGQDVLKNDQLGLLNLTEEALMRRDEIVFTCAMEQGSKCPIVMLLAGGYQTMGAKIQADSIKSLYTKGLIWGGHRSGERSLSRPRMFPRTKGTISSGSQGAKRP